MVMSRQERPSRIGLDARLISGRSGGVEQAIICLAYGLSQLDDGNEEYYFLTYANHQEWLRPYISGPCRILPDSVSAVLPRQPTWRKTIRRWLPDLAAVKQNLRQPHREIVLPRSNGLIEAAGIDLMHFTKQSAFLTAVPSLYQPWDLQHLHFPHYFSADAITRRETSYRAFCRQAALISTASEWVKDDLIEQYQVPVNKIRVIPFAPVLDAYPQPSPEEIQACRRRLELPDQFMLYPAQTYPHKNHLRLLQALAHLRDQDGLQISLVCSGTRNEFYETTIRRFVRQQRLQAQVRFTGYVSPLNMQCLYHSARALIFPSLFEGWGFPVLEAFQAGLPLASSTVTSLPELVGDAGLLFDAYDCLDIAGALRALWLDEVLRARLRVSGSSRGSDYSPQKTALAFRALYRELTRQHESATGPE
jgi:glycosyltransferase involved in cell wall biosynthesis